MEDKDVNGDRMKVSEPSPKLSSLILILLLPISYDVIVTAMSYELFVTYN